MRDFIAANPGVALSVGGVLCAGVVSLLALCWQLIKERATNTEHTLTEAVTELKNTMRTGLREVTQLIDRVDARHIAAQTDLYGKFNTLAQDFRQLRGEHDNKGDNCPGAMALHQLLKTGTIDRRASGE